MGGKARSAEASHVLMRNWPLIFVALLIAGPARAQSHPTYWAYIANESSDIVSLVRFDGREVVEEKAIPVGFHPADLDGPCRPLRDQAW
ncbi:MAG TPA: hypothetical protein EYO20_10750 [Gemmatimonadetes bacterium]|nr:hypothetical protein [Gemmatimonadota bacterium]